MLTDRIQAKSYRKSLQTCRIAREKRGWANGAFLTGRTLRNTQSIGKGSACQNLVGPAGMAADLEYNATQSSRRLRHAVTGLHRTTWVSRTAPSFRVA